MVGCEHTSKTRIQRVIIVLDFVMNEINQVTFYSGTPLFQTLFGVILFVSVSVFLCRCIFFLFGEMVVESEPW